MNPAGENINEKISHNKALFPVKNTIVSAYYRYFLPQ